MSATSGGGSVSEGSDAGESSQSTMSATDSPSTSFQAKRGDNVTKISLEETSHHADLTGSKINLTSDERQSKDGVVNMAFDYEESGVRMGAGGGGAGNVGEAVSVGVGGAINGSEKKEAIPEAVNLELVNMVPYSNGNGTSYGVPVNGIPGIPAKKDSEQVDMSTPYDEYFVPVNEHKKYMRGEKLYVTKDKRRPTSWRRCLSWIVACTVISVVLIVAILAGTGVILSQDQNLVQEASIGRNFAGANLKPSVTQKSSITPMPTGTKDWSTPTTDMSYMYVPRSIESELIIDNIDFDPALLDANSSAYKEFSTMMEDQLKMILFDKETLEFGASELGLRVVNISREPFKVNYRIGWNYKQGVNNPPEPIKMEDVKRRLVESLARNEGFIDKYHFDMEGIKVNHVINVCQMNNGGCSHLCYYNYKTQLFTCTCPTNLVLDKSGKNCVEWMGSLEQDVLSVPTHYGHESTGAGNEEEYVSHHEHDLHHHAGMVEPTAEPAPEPTGEHDEHYKEHEPSAEPAPEPTSEHDGHYKEHEPAAEPAPEPTSEHDDHYKEHEPSAEPAPEPTSEHDEHNKEHEPSAEPAPEPTSEHDDKHKEHEPSAEPVPEPTAEPAPEPTAEHDGHYYKEHEPSAEPTPEPTADHDHRVYKEHEPSAEPTAEPTADHDHHGFKEHEPSAEPTPEPTGDHDHQGLKEHEPSAEPTPEPTGDHDHQGLKEHEPSAEPTPEPTSDQDHEPAAEPTAEPAPEPTSDHGHKDKEPAAEPSPSHDSDTSGHDKISDTVLKKHEPAAEPTPELNNDQEPAPEPTSAPDSVSTNHDSGDHSQDTHTLHGGVYVHSEDKTEEPAPEPTPEPTAGDEGDLHLTQNDATGHKTDSGSQQNESTPSLSLGEHDHSTAQMAGFDTDANKTQETTAEHDASDPHSGTTVSPHSTAEEIGMKFLPPHMQVLNNTASMPEEDNLHTTEHHRVTLEDILVRQPADGSNSTVQDLVMHGRPVVEDVIIDKSTASESGHTEMPGEPIMKLDGVTGGHEGHMEQPVGRSTEKTMAGTHEGTTESTVGGSLAAAGVHEGDTERTVGGTEATAGVHEGNTERTVGGSHEGSTERAVGGSQATAGVHEGNTERTIGEGQATAGIHEGNTEPAGSHDSNPDRAVAGNVAGSHEPSTERATVDGHIGNTEQTVAVGNEPSGMNEGVTDVPGVIEYKPEHTASHEQKGAQSTERIQEGNETEKPSSDHVLNLLHNSGSTTEPERQQESFTVPVSIISENDPRHESSTERHMIVEVDSRNAPQPQAESEVKDKPQQEIGDDDGIKTTEKDGSVLSGPVNPGDEKQNETTKSPEEISNNIKDESLDNEEFNTLLENEEKDILNKYSGKPSKPDKKKLKDFVKNDKRANEATFKPPVTPEDFFLQKHVTGNTFDLDYRLQNEHTTKHDEELASLGPHHGVPGVSLIPDGISGHDVNVFQTIAPESKTEASSFEEVDAEDNKKSVEKDGEGKLEKDYGKFDKDYKYDKQKGAKKKDLKKKVGGKDGKNVELDDRKYYTDLTGKDFEEARNKEATEAVGGGDEAVTDGVAKISEGTTVEAGQKPGDSIAGSTPPEHIFNGGLTETESPGTVYDGIPHGTTFTASVPDSNSTFVVYESTDGTFTIGNSTTAHPTIVIHGQSGSLQDGHTVKFTNTTVLPGGEEGFANFTFPNGSTVHPTVIIRGQSGALQDGHETRFVTGPKGFMWTTTQDGILGNSTVYRIENGSLPDTVFDGHFNPLDGHYHMFTNESGTFVYSNVTTQPTFVIKGSSGDFGNSTAYIIGNGSSFTPSIREVTSQPHGVQLNETLRFTNQVSPATFSSGTAYKVNNYFGYISKCAAGQFQCVNGTSKRGSACISLSSKCDSINDCSDGSDEQGCIENGCPGNFQCSDGTCLKRHLVCNGIVDCSDGSDEQKCESWKCEFDEFQCPSGRCIPVVWQCDSKPDCDNHTDEYHCQTSCGNDEYLCPEGWCIPLTYKCNGVKECSNGEDEQLCDCSHDEFRCNTGGCVPQTQVCNGVDDCPDRSDEWGCVKLEPDTNLLKIRTPSGDYEPVCADNWQAQRSDDVCAFLGYHSSVPIENESNSSTTTETSYYVLKNDTTENFNKKFLVNLKRSNGTCSSGKFVEVSCQEFSCGFLSMTDSSSVEARLVGGMSAATGQWPSVALLYNIRNFHSCTANVLTPRWVLASYNCLKMGNKNLNQQDWKFFGGSTVFEAEKEDAETRNIVSIIPHPQVKFNQFLFSNDLALVELDQPMQFTSKVGAVCLPEKEIQPRQICVTAGWGMNDPEDKIIRQQLQYLPVPTMNLTECNSTNHYSGFITEDKICAGYNSPEKSLCYNEEGAPLMCINDKNVWELQGVLSYHRNCGRGSHPSIFSSIQPVKDWIKQTIGNSFEQKITPNTKR